MVNKFTQQLKELVLEKVNQIIQTLDTDKQLGFGLIMKEFCEHFALDEMIFQHLYDAYKQQIPELELYSRDTDIYYRREETLHTITFLEKSFSLEEATYHGFLTSCLELSREVLPLGTVVELDEAYFKPSQEHGIPAKVVITGRFIAPQGYNTYFPYCGVLYPFGEMKKDAQIHFTTPLIKNVLHKGYKDQAEEALEIIMKQELIIDKNLQSIEFSTQDMHKLQKEIELKQRAGEQ
ncbi:DUF4176 domain-containing protein [Metabacillus malikii]|uniref:DUF4176 domain-containing protein n=1 Tax=Metabacillus malikii TaxID=1504265 RepID=A0ABT9ZLE9_9BACI|nr:DUF4176 domain-containing protein [Metabacillus malikii]MDQ0233113.1 hypothetical protein [Metabacillus malikii]